MNKKILKIVLNVILIIILVFLVLLLLLPIVGINNKVVVSGSMEPNIHVGSLIYIKQVNFNNLNVGDVITYSLGDTTITHRIISIDYDSLTCITKGDANESIDLSAVSSSQIVGKVFLTIPILGYIVYFIKQNLVLIIGLIITIVLIIVLIKLIKNYKKENLRR